MLATVAKPNLAEQYLDIRMETALKQIRYFAEAGVKFLFSGCDMASNEGSMFSARSIPQACFT